MPTRRVFCPPLELRHSYYSCVLDPMLRHRVHVSRLGLYRWDDSGRIVSAPVVPLFTAGELSKLYEAASYPEPAPWPDTPLGAAVAAAQPRNPFPGQFAAHWREFGSRPPVARIVSRIGLTLGFGLMVCLTIGILSALILALVALAGVFAVWIST